MGVATEFNTDKFNLDNTYGTLDYGVRGGTYQKSKLTKKQLKKRKASKNASKARKKIENDKTNQW